MAVPVARVHLKVAHAALPALLPTPPKWKMLPMLSTSSQCVSTILPKPPAAKPGRADAAERWDAHKKAVIPASSSLSAGMSSLVSSTCKISRANTDERWDVHKKRCLPRAELLDDGQSSSTSSIDIDDAEEEILWKPRAMYAGPGFAVATPQPSMVPVPTAFLVPVA